MKAELKELIQNYGIEILVFDGNWDPSWTHQRGSDLYRYLHGLKTDLLVSNRVDDKAGRRERRGPWATKKRSGYSIQSPGILRSTRAITWTVRSTLAAPPRIPGKRGSRLGEQWAWKANDKYKSPEDSSATWWRRWGAAATSI